MMFPTNSPDEFSLTLVDTINDADYRANSFMLTQKSTYNSLYGHKSDEELALQKETAIQIDYNFSSLRSDRSDAKWIAIKKINQTNGYKII